MKKLITLAALLAFAISTWGISLPDSLNYTFRIGYNIGGTAPVGMPATIRKLNSYDFQPDSMPRKTFGANGDSQLECDLRTRE